jgi:hypothetical protein
MINGKLFKILQSNFLNIKQNYFKKYFTLDYLINQNFNIS